MFHSLIIQFTSNILCPMNSQTTANHPSQSEQPIPHGAEAHPLQQVIASSSSTKKSRGWVFTLNNPEIPILLRGKYIYT